MTDPTLSKTVLVVEDNPGDARLVELFLMEGPGRQFRVVKADRLSLGLAALESEPVDVVLLDLSLPDSFGLDTLATVKAAHPRVPVVVLTGNADEALAIEALRKGAQDYLVKGQGDGDLMRRSVRYAIERAGIAIALEDSEARFRAVFENAGMGVILGLPDGTFAEANPAFCAMVGYSLDELKGLNWRAITHPDDLAANEAVRAGVLDGTKDGYRFTKRYLTKDGRQVWAQLTAKAVRGDSPSEVRFIVAVVEDVTERKRLEDQMRLAATVFENTGDGLFITDAQSLIIHVNPAFTDITGYCPDDVVGKDPKVLASGRHGPDFYEHMWRSLIESGKWQGEIWNRRKTGEMFAGWINIVAVRDPSGTVTNYVAVFSDITSKKQHEERLSYQANHDPLTQLPNRTLFQERLNRALARAQRNHTMVALLFIDLDHFKQVNDTLGHLAGDLLLQQASERLSSCTRQGDTVARLAGDEFTIILEDVADPRDAAIVAHKIVHVMAEPFDLSGSAANISSSIGVAMYPVDSGDAQGLIKLADAAMYRAKNMGRNGCQFHSETVNAQAFERLALEGSLRDGLEKSQFRLFYQPIFDMATGQPVAVEALLRWQHPDVGLVVPGQFLALADETGLILPIGRWVFQQACSDLRLLRANGAPDLAMHLNLNGRQLRQQDLIESIACALEDAELPPASLVLEVPESSLSEKGHDNHALFDRINALGMGILIDEFGSGFSSFAFLRRLPAGGLKVAQSFVRNIADGGSDDSEIVTAIVALARGLHMSINASGIETEEQLAFLATYGCQRAQGFLLARPMPMDELRDFLAAGQIPPALAKRINAA